MERRTELGVYWEDKQLGVAEDCYPLNAHFFEESKAGKVDDKPCAVVGKISPPYEGAPDGRVMVVFEGSDTVVSYHGSRVIYERKVFNS